MTLMLFLTICLVQTLLLANAMEIIEEDLRPFLTIHLPYSVKRDEIINVPGLVYNFAVTDLDVEVTLDNSDGAYENIDFNHTVISGAKLTKSIRVRAHATAMISFLIRPKVIGNVVLIFTAISPADFDIVHKTMKVIPEGITQYANRAYFVNLKNKPEHNSLFELEFPKDLVPDSQHIEVGVVGDIMGPVFNNLDNLVRMPTGCGEQTMSFLVANYLVMKYLMNSKRLTPTIEAKLRYNLDTGYRNLLNYRHTDGSFSNFGPSLVKEKPQNGSTWLTACVLRFLSQIKEFRNVNEKIIEEGLAYLSKQQAENGIFTEKGDYFYFAQRNYIALTSAAVLAFLEHPAYDKKYSREKAKGLEFIAKNNEMSLSPRVWALGLYTLNKAKHAAAKIEVTRLRAAAQIEMDRYSYFRTQLWHVLFRHDVQSFSYILLTLLDEKSIEVDNLIPFINWLMAQRNSLGGFATTQDTIVGLTALLKFAELAHYEPARMDVDIVSKDKNETIKLTENNGISYKSVELPPKTQLIKFTAKGSGAALVQIAYQYNTFKIQEDPYPSFSINIKKLEINNKRDGLEMFVCVKYVGKGESSNMALLEISTPSGYVIDDESLKDIEKLKRVSNTELKNSGTLLIVYFDHLDKNVETCLKVKALRTHVVAMQKPTLILLYDYYDTVRKATAFYYVDLKLCDICVTEEECRKCNK